MASNRLLTCKFCKKFDGAWGQTESKHWKLFPIQRNPDSTPILTNRGHVMADTAQKPHECFGHAPIPQGDEQGGQDDTHKQRPEQGESGDGDGQQAEGEGQGDGEGQGQGEGDEKEPWKSMAKNLEPYIKSGTDEKKVREIAKDEAKKATDPLVNMMSDLERKIQPGEKELVIKLEDAQGEQIKIEGHFHEMFPKLVACAKMRIPVLLIGPPGGGKSEANMALAKLLNIPYYELVLGPTDTSSKAVGFFDAQGRVVATEYRKAWTEGGVLHVEEIDNASAAILTTLNSMWANGIATFPDGQYPKHKDFVLVASANTDLRGGDVNHSQRRPLDAATTDRFMRMRWAYDEVLEKKIVQGINPQALPWLDWVRKVRKFAAKHYPKLVVSPRASIKGAVLLKQGGWTLEELADGNVFIGGCDMEARDRILRDVPLPKSI